MHNQMTNFFMTVEELVHNHVHIHIPAMTRVGTIT